MTINKPEVVAWRWRKPVVNDQGETVGETAWELSDTREFLPWWTNDPLIRLGDYERLQAECEKLRKQAAPDLLEALEEIVSAADGDGWNQLDANLRKARAAIAKATGG